LPFPPTPLPAARVVGTSWLEKGRESWFCVRAPVTLRMVRGETVLPHTPPPAALQVELSQDLLTTNTATAACAMIQFPKCQQECICKDVNRCPLKDSETRDGKEQGDTVTVIRVIQQRLI